ncbi:pre-toxin TG domain-containing protein [Rossellomorea marisflavi]|uniref:pre-toxin TG domain-containing protein n=1 Tax=Rossellomorea marisflavi TaxID=189381 RepID=UPI003D2EA74E
MTEIKVDPDQLKELADGIQKSEDKVDDALGKLSWTFSSFLVGITQANTGRIKDVQAELEHHMKKYQSKLDELQEGVMLTRAQILEADKNGWDKTGEFGLELLGVYDAERIFAEYDPVTGKKITGWQRAMATGMTLATLFPPAKGVVLLGKMGVKGLKALKLIENGAEVIKQTKNVLNPAVLKKMAQASYNTVIKGPIAKTSAYLKQTAENVKNIELSLNFNVFGQLNRFDPVLEGVNHVPGKTVGEITEGIGKSARDMVGKAKDTIVRFSGKGKGTGKSPSDFADRDKLKGHFDKHGKEFNGLYKNADEYLKGAKEVINNGIKVEYQYKGEIRTGYVKFMGNNKNGKAKFEFVGTNNNGNITTYHTQSGKKIWKTINGKNIPVVNPAE